VARVRAFEAADNELYPPQLIPLLEKLVMDELHGRLEEVLVTSEGPLRPVSAWVAELLPVVLDECVNNCFLLLEADSSILAMNDIRIEHADFQPVLSREALRDFFEDGNRTGQPVDYDWDVFCASEERLGQVGPYQVEFLGSSGSTYFPN
jgi:hypothetical protein